MSRELSRLLRSDAHPSVYGPSCLWIGDFPKIGYESQMFNNTCALNPGDHYIDFLADCNFAYSQTFAPHLRTHHNRVLVANHNDTRGVVSGCVRPPPPPPPSQRRSVSSCSPIFANTTVSGSYEHDIRGLYGNHVATAEDCRAMCKSLIHCLRERNQLS